MQLTASFGLATFPHDAQDKRGLLAAADHCLFRSKENGKNQISVAGRPPSGGVGREDSTMVLTE